MGLLHGEVAVELFFFWGINSCARHRSQFAESCYIVGAVECSKLGLDRAFGLVGPLWGYPRGT
jgi:hypothetical protein